MQRAGAVSDQMYQAQAPCMRLNCMFGVTSRDPRFLGGLAVAKDAHVFTPLEEQWLPRM